MSGYSLSRLVTRACAALIFLAAIPARADIIRHVTATEGLPAAAAAIMTTRESGRHVVQFSAYNSVGRFRLDSPPAVIDTLVFERNGSLESDSAVLVAGDTALLEIKNMRRGTVVLRGLAFHLASPQARLLAGAEAGKENLHLILDSCFIFGDSTASSFLTWLGVAGSRIEFRRSFFVFRAGNALQTKAILTATTTSLANNLFHFGGQISATVLSGGLFEFRSNTVVRTQCKLTSETFQGARYEITRNFIAHRGTLDAFGGADSYFLWAATFHPDESSVRHNRILGTWKGFDHPGSNPRLFGDATNQVRDAAETDKAVTELWNWYRPLGASDSTGHGFGQHRRMEPYNIFPGTSSASFTFEGNPGNVHFKPAPFPRQFTPVRTPMPVPAGLDSIRFHSPGRGALRFGSFQVESIVLDMDTAHGDAQLFSSDSTFQFRPQRIGSPYLTTQPRAFPNGLPSARYFFIGFKGNTPKGSQVRPGPGSQLSAQDSLAYETVDSAGYTNLFVKALDVYPDDLRNLNRTFSVQTTAQVSGTMAFGSTAGIQPLWSDQVYWWRPQDTLLHHAPRQKDGRFVASAPAARNFNAYLVERLAVRRGRPTVFPLPGGGEVRATSSTGFQLRIDSSYTPDALRFGRASKGFSMTFAGRQAGDSLTLRLPGGPDTEVFRVAGDSFPTVPSTLDSSRFHTVPIALGDSGIRLFSGIRFNVMADRSFDETLDGVRISGLVSNTSGRISILPFDDKLLQRGLGTDDTLPSNAKLLGAKGIRTLSLDLTGPWSAAFPVARPGDSTRMVAYAWDGLRWRPLPPPAYPSGDAALPTVTGLESADQAVAVFELLKPASEYVQLVPAFRDRSVSVTVTHINDSHRPIQKFSLRVLHVDEFGDVKTLSQGPAEVGQTLTESLKGLSGLFMYAVIYHTEEGDYNFPSYVPIPDFNWIPAKISVGANARKAGREWHLFGSPYQSTFSKTLFKRELSDPEADDTLDVVKLKSVDGAAAWEPIRGGESLELNPGDAFLVNSARVLELHVDTTAKFVVEKVHDLGPHSGWRFVSPPYPMTFQASAVGTSKEDGVGGFLELAVDPLANPIKGKEREYSWKLTDKLKAFTGYAYKFSEGEVLTFNPWSALAPPPAPKRGVRPTPLGTVQVNLRVEGRTRSMRLFAGGGIRELPYLPAPGGGLEMRVGGKGGWFLKKVDDLLGLDESVIIRSPASARGRLELGLEGLPAQRPDWRARLIHLASGQVLDPAAGFPLSEGEQEYRLVAGTEAFLAERIAAFKNGLPPDLVLSQNYPNPFRTHTRINLEWPVLAGGAAASGRKARLDVFDARGRRVQTMDLGEIRAGRQVITLDGSRWEPGFYTYRLTVAQAGSKAFLQRRMLVSP